MNLNKQDFAVALVAVGMADGIKEVEKAAVAVVGSYVTGSKEEQAEFLREAKSASGKALAMFQQLDAKLEAELQALAEGGQ